MGTPCLEETQDLFDREAAALQESNVTRPFPIIRGQRAKARAPDGLEAGTSIVARGAKARGDAFLAHAAGPQVVRELQGPETARLRARHLLREARVRKPALGGELVEDGIDVLALLGVSGQLAGELRTRVLAAREKRKGA